MAKLPQKVKVGGATVTVVPQPIEKDALSYGEYDNRSLQIMVDTKLKGDQLRSTLLHECLHAVFVERSLPMLFNPQQEEIIVAAMESGLFALLRDNPKLVTYLMERD